MLSNDISSVSVHLLPPDQIYDLSKEEIIALVEILNDAVIYYKDNTYGQYNGQAVEDKIVKENGTTIIINASNPFLIINNLGYRTKYKSCEELNTLVNIIRSDE